MKGMKYIRKIFRNNLYSVQNSPWGKANLNTEIHQIGRPDSSGRAIIPKVSIAADHSVRICDIK